MAITAVWSALLDGTDASGLTASAGKLGDELRSVMYDTFYKKIGCQSKNSISAGDAAAHYLIGTKTSWGGAYDGSWTWQTSSSFCAAEDQDPLAAYALLKNSALKGAMKATDAAADYETSLERQLEFLEWLQSAAGPISGGATNSYNGRYETYPSGTSTFFDMAYLANPKSNDPESGEDGINQAQTALKLAKLFYQAQADGDIDTADRCKAILDKLVGWFVENVYFGDDAEAVGCANGFALPAQISFSGAPETWTGTATENNNLTAAVSGCTCSDMEYLGTLAAALTYYAAAEGASVPNASGTAGEQALCTAISLIDAASANCRDAKGFAAAETCEGYTRIFEQKVWVPTSYGTGTMPNNDTVANGATFLSLRSFLKDDSAYAALKADYDSDGETHDTEFTYHVFAGQCAMLEGLAAISRFYDEKLTVAFAGGAAEHSFGNILPGYASEERPAAVEAELTANESLTLVLPTAASFDIEPKGSDWTTANGVTSISLAEGGKTKLIIRPKAGLSAGSYSASVPLTDGSTTLGMLKLGLTVLYETPAPSAPAAGAITSFSVGVKTVSGQKYCLAASGVQPDPDAAAGWTQGDGTELIFEKDVSGAALTSSTGYSICTFIPGDATHLRSETSSAAAATLAADKISALSVKTQPTKLAYIIGERIDLAGLVVEITLSDKAGTKADVPFASFADYGISAPALSAGSATNGRGIAITADASVCVSEALTAETANITVSKVKPLLSASLSEAAVSGGGRVTLTINAVNPYDSSYTEGLPTAADIAVQNSAGLSPIAALSGENGVYTAVYSIPNRTEQIAFTVTSSENGGYLENQAGASLSSVFEESEQEYQFNIKTDATGGGSISAVSAAATGKTVRFTAKPDALKKLASVKAVSALGQELDVAENPDGSFSFVQPFGGATIYAVFEDDNPYQDVAESDWFYGDVLFVSANGYIDGTGDGLFSPKATESRGLAVLALWRAAGSPAPAGGIGFADVAEGIYCYDAVAWAAENGICGGCGDGLFHPEESVTREQLAALLCRLAKLQGRDMSPNASLDAYQDAANVSGWARASLGWAVGSGLINGKPGAKLDPLGLTSRAELAAVIRRYVK